MNKKSALVFSLLSLLLLSYTSAHSELIQARTTSISSRNAMSAWTQPKGHIYNQLYYGYHESTNKFTTIRRNSSGTVISTNSNVHKVNTDGFSANTVTYHAEFGITNSLTFFATIPWIDTTYDVIIKYSGQDGPDGIGDIYLGLRYKLLNDLLDSGTLVSVQGSIKIPEAYDYGDPVTETSLGDGQYDTSMDVLMGKEWDKGYLMFNAGYTFRFENNENSPYDFRPSDQVRALLGGAYLITSDLTLTGTLDWTKSIGNASVSDDLIIYNMVAGSGMAWEQDHTLIKDTLGLEQDILNLGIALAYNISDEIEAILRYNTDIRGTDGFGTKNAGQVSTYTLALVSIF